jgi:hypothetical protein
MILLHYSLGKLIWFPKIPYVGEHTRLRWYVSLSIASSPSLGALSSSSDFYRPHPVVIIGGQGQGHLLRHFQRWGGGSRSTTFYLIHVTLASPLFALVVHKRDERSTTQSERASSPTPTWWVWCDDVRWFHKKAWLHLYLSCLGCFVGAWLLLYIFFVCLSEDSLIALYMFSRVLFMFIKWAETCFEG